MAEPTKKPGVLGSIANALTNKDELAALEAAQKQLADAQAAAAKASQEVTALKAAGAKSSSEQAAVLKRAQDAEAAVKKLQLQLEEMARAKRLEERREQLDAEMKASIEAAKPKFIAEHTLTKEETLSHLSLKYYGSATKPYWMVIYEANKDVIGDNPNKVHSGLVVKIPELPANLKK